MLSRILFGLLMKDSFGEMSVACKAVITYYYYYDYKHDQVV